MKAKNQQGLRSLLPLLVATLLFGPSSKAFASDQDACTSMLQNAYGKYYGCTLKLYSKASKKGETVASLQRCRDKLDKLVTRALIRYGQACPDLTSSDLSDFADQCVADTADVSAGTLSPDAVATVDEACTGDTAFDPVARRCSPLAEIFAADPPAVESMTVEPLDGTDTANVEVVFSQQETRRLPRTFRIDVGARKPTTLTAKDTDRLTYTGTIPYDEKEWQVYNTAIGESFEAAAGSPGDRFEGRIKVGEEAVSEPFLPSGGQKMPLFPIPVFPIVVPAIDEEATLMVRHVNVVEDPTRTFDPCVGGTPMGKWTFGHLMTEMANQPSTAIDPEDLTRSFLKTWLTDQAVNGLTVPARTNMQNVIDQWEQASGGTGSLDLAIAPFRLMAIVNRTDLRDTSAFSPSHCGEGRFVFGLLDTNTCQPLPFGVIFEYGVPISGCRGCKKYARKWLDLQAPSLAPIGSPAYNVALETLTDIFTTAGADPSKPNGSALEQLRTNENALDPLWELREFVLSPSSGFLEPDTTKQNPDMPLNHTPDLTAWANPIAANICANNFTVPDEHPVGTPFLAGGVPYNISDFFDGPTPPTGLPDRCARFELSLNSCAGCHAAETATAFCHIGNGCRRNAGSPAILSGFLTGNSVVDPADGAPTRTFADLNRRRIDLWIAANVPCFPRLALPILKAVH